MSDEPTPFKAAYYRHLNPPVPAPPEPEPEPKFETFEQVFAYHNNLLREDRKKLNAHYRTEMGKLQRKAADDVDALLLRLRIDSYIKEELEAQGTKQ